MVSTSDNNKNDKKPSLEKLTSILDNTKITTKIFASYGVVVFIILCLIFYNVALYFNNKSDLDSHIESIDFAYRANDFLKQLTQLQNSVEKFLISREQIQANDLAQLIKSDLSAISSLNAELIQSNSASEQSLNELSQINDAIYTFVSTFNDLSSETIALNLLEEKLTVELAQKINTNFSDIKTSALRAGDQELIAINDNVMSGYNMTNVDIIRFLMEYNGDADKTILKQLKSTKNDAKRLTKTVTNRERKTLVKALYKDIQNYQKVYKKISKTAAKKDALLGKKDEFFSLILNKSNILSGIIQATLEGSMEEQKSNLDASFRNEIFVGIIVVLLSLLTAIIISRKFASDISIVMNVLENIRDQNYDLSFEGAERQDEFGQILNISSELVEKLKEAERLAQLEAEQQKEQLARSEFIEKMVYEFDEQAMSSIDNVANASNHVTTIAHRISRSVEDAKERSDNAHQASGQISTNVDTVAESSEQFSQANQEISEQVHKTTDLVQEFVEQVMHADKKTLSLSEATEKVAEILSIIQKIAGQINLLALNATIESVHAGEAGKGFAVVAGEVKNLAVQTADSTKEISGLVEGLQTASGEVLTIFEKIRKNIDSINGYMSNTTAAVEEQSATTGAINQNMHNAAQSVHTIKDDIAVIASTVSKSDESSNELLTSSNMLSEEAESLRQNISDFLKRIKTC